jgi:hypothetical protein
VAIAMATGKFRWLQPNSTQSCREDQITGKERRRGLEPLGRIQVDEETS